MNAAHRVTVYLSYFDFQGKYIAARTGVVRHNVFRQ